MSKDQNNITGIYNSFIDGLELVRIRLIESEVKASDSSPDPSHSSVENSYFFDYQPNPDGFEALCTFEFKFSNVNTKAGIGHINMKFGLTYLCKNVQAESEEFAEIFSIFSSQTLVINIWPFAREYLLDSMRSMDWPALVLPLIKPNNQAGREASNQKTARKSSNPSTARKPASSESVTVSGKTSKPPKKATKTAK